MKKNLLISILLVLVLLVSIVPFSVAAEEAEIKDIVILHTNDIHSRVIGAEAPGADGRPVKKGVIGYARYKTIIDTMKEVNEGRVLVLDAGDAIHGQNFATMSKGQSVIRLMNELGVQAMTNGNHEFNYGKQELLDAVKEADFPVMSANIVDENGELPFAANTIFEIEGIKIGVFGLTTPETKYKANPKNTEGYEFLDVAEVAQAQVDALKEEGADVVILLAHLGVDEASEVNTLTVLDKVKDIDVIIDGHSHTLLPEGEMHGETLLAQTGAHLANVGVVTLSFNGKEVVEKKAEVITFLEAMQYAENEEIKASIAAIEEENARVTEVEVAELSADLEGEREDVRTRETNMADLITDAMLKRTGADAVITNGGGIRASIAAGTVTFGDLLTVLPFGNMVTVIEVSGQDIQDALNYGVDAYPEPAGKFPQVAGITYVIAKDGDANVAKDIMIAGEALDLEATYKLATNDFMAVGGDGYTMFEGKEQIVLEGLMVDVVRDYVLEIAEDGSFSYETDARITVEE